MQPAQTQSYGYLRNARFFQGPKRGGLMLPPEAGKFSKLWKTPIDGQGKGSIMPP